MEWKFPFASAHASNFPSYASAPASNPGLNPDPESISTEDRPGCPRIRPASPPGFWLPPSRHRMRSHLWRCGYPLHRRCPPRDPRRLSLFCHVGEAAVESVPFSITISLLSTVEVWYKKIESRDVSLIIMGMFNDVISDLETALTAKSARRHKIRQASLQRQTDRHTRRSKHRHR